MKLISVAILLTLAATAQAQIDANIPIQPLTNVQGNDGYFSDPFHVPFQDSQKVYIAGTTHSYLECDGKDLSAKCAKEVPNNYKTGDDVQQAADNAGVKICGAAGIHPYQSGKDDIRAWDAVVTLHVAKGQCSDGLKDSWSVIVHAHPANASIKATPPDSWVGDKVLVGSFTDDVDANYDGKYYRTPAGQLYLVYQKQHVKDPKRDGVAAWPMDDFKALTPGASPTFLLLPNEGLKSEDYVQGNNSFKLIETGNIRAINGTFVMAYSAGAFNRKTYKIGVAYSNTFLPAGDDGYRKVMKNNPDGLWGSTGDQEVYYLLQADEQHAGWHYVKDQVQAPGVPTVAQLGPDDGWVLLFAGYDPSENPDSDSKFDPSHRRPYFVRLNVNVPEGKSVKQATDAELQNWIEPVHG